MSVSLQKGQKVSLVKEGDKGLSSIVIGLGWDEVKRSKGLFAAKPLPIDCDASALLLINDKLSNKDDIVYYGKLKHKSGAVNHMGDNLTGAGDGDDEQIMVDLLKLPKEYNKLVVVVNIYDAIKKKQHFGLIENAFIRLVDAKTNKEICRYNLSESYEGMTAMIFGEVYKYDGEWKFNAVGEPTKDAGLPDLIKRYQ